MMKERSLCMSCEYFPAKTRTLQGIQNHPLQAYSNLERSIDGTEYEPVGLKEGIGSPLELLYSWVDTKPVTGVTHYRIKQIDNEGKLVAQADPKSVMSPETSPLFIDKSTRMVQVK